MPIADLHTLTHLVTVAAPILLIALITGEDVIAGLLSVGFGALSAVLPIANAEAYVIAANAIGFERGLWAGITIGIGQTIGKCALFLGVRHGKDLRIFHRFRRTPGVPIRFPRLRGFIDRLLLLVGSPWGIPVTLLAAVVGIPPLYGVALVAGASSIPAPVFAVTVLVGRCLRFCLLALGVDAGLSGLDLLHR